MKRNDNYSVFGLYYHRQPGVVRTRLREKFVKAGLKMSTVNSYMYSYTNTPRNPSAKNMKIIERVTGQDIEILFPL